MQMSLLGLITNIVQSLTGIITQQKVPKKLAEKTLIVNIYLMMIVMELRQIYALFQLSLILLVPKDVKGLRVLT